MGESKALAHRVMSCKLPLGRTSFRHGLQTNHYLDGYRVEILEMV